MKMLKKIIVLFVFLSVIQNINAQETATIRGFVYEQKTGEPVMFTNVYLYKTSIGAPTDANGYFSITKVPAGKYTLMVTSMGYDTIRESISIKQGEILSKKLYVKETSIQLKTVNITAEKEQKINEVRTSVVTVSPKQIYKIPAIGGQADLAQYLQVLPGVVFTGDQGGQLYIRGGSPIQNKVLLDGMTIYNPFHSIGLFSVFETDIIRSADVYTGGFGAEYGGRVSSIMDINTRDGNKKRFGGKLSASPFAASYILEGPIYKGSKGNDNTVSFLFAGKNSLIEESSKQLYNYIDTNGLPYNFDDYYGKISFVSNNGSKVNVFGFNFTDNVAYKKIAKYNWDQMGFGSNFLVIPSSSTTIIEGTVAYSSYKITLKEGENKPRTSSVNGFNVNLGFTSFYGKDDVKYGLELSGFATDYFFFNQFNLKMQQRQNTTEIAAFVKYKKHIGKLILEPSFRIHYYASLQEMSPEPRLSAKWNTFDFLRFKLAGGFYSQNILSASSDRDVVNLFYGFLSGPDNLPLQFRGEDVNKRLQKAKHIILGTEIDINKSISINIEGYLKDFNQLININRNKLYDDIAENSSIPDLLKKDYTIEKGTAKGFDVTFKYDQKRFYLWLVYSYNIVDRKDELITYNPHFDRRHNINLVSTYTFGVRRDWELSARLNYGSGFPFTKTKGVYELLPLGDLSTVVTTLNGDLDFIYGDLNKGRLPDYYRMDVSIKKWFFVGENGKLEINAGITNVYNWENIFYFDRVTYKRVNQLPFMPSAGLTYSF